MAREYSPYLSKQLLGTIQAMCAEWTAIRESNAEQAELSKAFHQSDLRPVYYGDVMVRGVKSGSWQAIIGGVYKLIPELTAWNGVISNVKPLWSSKEDFIAAMFQQEYAKLVDCGLSHRWENRIPAEMVVMPKPYDKGYSVKEVLENAWDQKWVMRFYRLRYSVLTHRSATQNFLGELKVIGFHNKVLKALQRQLVDAKEPTPVPADEQAAIRLYYEVAENAGLENAIFHRAMNSHLTDRLNASKVQKA